MAGGKCNRCGTSNTKFKFFNNKKIDQPRYQCLSCTAVTGKPYFFNPNPKRQHHKDGYAKLPKEETEELKKLVKICDKCDAVNNVKFRGYNNGNMNQPRYVCRGCNKLFSPLKKSKAVIVRAVVVDTTEPSNQFQTQTQTQAAVATTSEAVHQDQIPQQHQVIPYGYQPTQLRTPDQNHINYQRAILQQQIALQNQQSQNHYYQQNPIPSSQQHIPTGIPLPQLVPSFQNHHPQQQFAPQFQQQQPQYPTLQFHNSDQWNPRNFPQQQSPQSYYNQPSLQNDLHQRTTMFQQQHLAPRNQQLHYQPRIPQNYQGNSQQQFPTGIQQPYPPYPPYQIQIYNVLPSENQQHPLQPASQSNNNHPGARNEQEPAATASLAATRSSSTASPLTQQSITEVLPDGVSDILGDTYFEEMMKFGKRESIKS